LERLIETFRQLSDNETLVTELRRFKDERNFLSHQGISYCLDPDDELDYGAMSEVEGRLHNIHTEASRLRIAIHEEANKFRGHLWFDDLTKQGG